MKMQLSPASTYSHQHTITPVDNHTTRWPDWLQGHWWRQKHQRFQTTFLRLSWDWQRKSSAMLLTY